MANVNKVILVGRIGQDAVTKTVGSSNVVSFTLATSESYTTKTGEKKDAVQWHNCEAWNKEKLAPYLTKGKELYVEGSIRYDKAELGGKTVTYTKIRVDSVQFVGSKDSNATAEGKTATYSGPNAGSNDLNPAKHVNDLPF